MQLMSVPTEIDQELGSPSLGPREVPNSPHDSPTATSFKFDKAPERVHDKPNIHDEVIQKITSGIQCVVSFSGYSQYTAGSGGASACGLAAFNCARIILEREFPNRDTFAVIRSMLERDTMEEILYICTRWKGGDHLDSEEIHQSPLFRNSLVSQGLEYRSPSFDEFRAVLLQLRAISPKTTAAIITRPPEIVAVLKIATEPDNDIFVVFDSHHRALHPDGAGFVFNSTLDGAAVYLQELFQFDQGLLDDPTLQWQAQMLSNFSAMLFTANPNSKDAMNQQDAVIMSSLAVLTLKAEVAKLTSNNSVLHAENEQLQGQVDNMELEMDQLKHTIHRLKEASAKADKGKGRDHRSGRSSYGNNAWQEVPKSSPRHSTSNTSQEYPPLHGSYGYNDTSTHVNNYTLFGSGGRRLDDTSGFSSLASTSNRITNLSGSRLTSFSALPEQEDENMTLALRLQAEYAEEDRLLDLQRQKLQKHMQKMFDCKICMEAQPEDVICRLDFCGHAFCRDCVRNYAISKIQERIVPILCPVCATEKDAARPGVVDARMVEMLGISKEDYAHFVEMELAAFSILVQCRQCKKGAFVDKTEYQEAKVVSCPIPGCLHTWCKACSLTIDFSGPPHSCDGTSELNHLMAEKGWKHCPGCKTPTEKTSGCNHMTCMSRGCNTHFCYICGALIVKSINRTEIDSRVQQHYGQQCRLFEVPPELGARNAAAGPAVPRQPALRQVRGRRRP